MRKNIDNGFGVVHGGAKGIDSISLNYTLEHSGCAVAFLLDNIKQRVRDPYFLKYIFDGDLLVYSHVSPFAPKGRSSFVVAAMERNKLIYSSSMGTAVVRSDTIAKDG